jgi:hypothetical protein
MSNPWEMDWENEAGKIDEEASNRGKLDDGYYRCRLAETTMNNEDGSQKLKFVVSHGEFVKRVHFETLWNPRFADDEQKRKSSTEKAQIFAVRLGAVPRDAKGRCAPNWNLAVGKEFVLKIVNRKYTPDKGKNAGKEQTSCDVGYSGLWPLDHDDMSKLKNDVRASLGLPAIAGNDPKPAAAGAGGAVAGSNGANGGANGGAGNNAGAGSSVPTGAAPPVSKMAMDIFGG